MWLLLLGCAGGEEQGLAELPGLQNVAVGFMAFDPDNNPLAGTQTKIVRWSESREAWGEVGLGGREPQFLIQSFAVASDGGVYAATGNPDVSVYYLPPGGGFWESRRAGLPAKQVGVFVAADRSGRAYTWGQGIYRWSPGATSWEALDADWSSGGCAPPVFGADDTLYLDCDGGRIQVGPDAASPEPITAFDRIVSAGPDGSLNVILGDLAGRLDPGATAPVPYPAFPADVYQSYATWSDAYYATTPLPFGVADDGTAWACGRGDGLGNYLAIFRLSPGDEQWTLVDQGFEILGRYFALSPGGDVYTYDYNGNGVWRQEAR